jgi:hypothetical protein
MVAVVDHPARGSQVGIIAKRTYRVVGQRCVVLDEQVPIVEIPRLSEDQAMLLHDVDGVLNRQEVDVVIEGKARVLRPTPSFDLRLRVGNLDRKLRVFGTRVCYRGPGGRLRFSDPTPIEEVPLDWTSAYGGFDSVALARHGDPLEGFCAEAKKPYNPRFGRYAYPRNRAGKGYLIEATDEALERCGLPSIEEPLQLLSPDRLAIGSPDRWPAGPFVAGLGWLSYGNFPRSAMLGVPSPYDATACPPASFFEVTVKALNVESIAPHAPLQQRFDLRSAQQAALGMRTPSVAPGAPVSIVNAHPQKASWDFTLARETPVLAIQMPGGRPISLDAKIRTVFVQPELDRVSVVWVGEHREATPVGPGKRSLIKYGVQWPG